MLIHVFLGQIVKWRENRNFRILLVCAYNLYGQYIFPDWDFNSHRLKGLM
jgi:hypothetical protein